MSDPAIKAALLAASEEIRAVLRGPNSCGKWATCAVAPCACADAAAAAAVAAFLRAMPHHQMKRRTGIKPARYSIDANSTAKLAAVVERAAKEAGGDR